MKAVEQLISGLKTPTDWYACRDALVAAGKPADWNRAHKDFFHTRLKLRYLNPIRLLQKHGTFQGEGFSILALQCTLIEFLESTVQGKNYHLVKKKLLGQFEYNESGKLFAEFLTTRDPFKSEFDNPLAKDFYGGIRCGLLHEAQTKGGWRVWANDPDSKGRIVDRGQRIVFRNGFQQGLDKFLGWYENALPNDAALQEAFIRKFNALCL